MSFKASSVLQIYTVQSDIEVYLNWEELLLNLDMMTNLSALE